MKFVATLVAFVGLASQAYSSAIPQNDVKRGVPGKPVFAHYMVGGISEAHVRQDIIDAQNLGLDAFALNYDTIIWWSTDTVDFMFDIADELKFHVFFSFDMNPTHFQKPSEFAGFLQKYTDRWSYFTYDSRPLVSTFGGDDISENEWSDFKKTVGNVMLVPGFYTTTPSLSMFDEKPSLDGVFNWNAWPTQGDGKIVVPTDEDKIFQQAAHDSGRLFMMGISMLQYKNLGGKHWYRRGEENLEYRLEQVLDMQPDMIEIITWNDGGESHYMGNVWDDPLVGDAGDRIHALTDAYDHRAYQGIFGPFINAWKAGDETTANMMPTNYKQIQGAFWHHTLLKDANCGGGKPAGIQNLEDSVSGVIINGEEQEELDVVVKSGNKQLGWAPLKKGYNKFKFDGLTTGTVTVEVFSHGTSLAKATGPLDVSNYADLCNYNFQVVSIES